MDIVKYIYIYIYIYLRSHSIWASGDHLQGKLPVIIFKESVKLFQFFQGGVTLEFKVAVPSLDCCRIPESCAPPLSPIHLPILPGLLF